MLRQRLITGCLLLCLISGAILLGGTVLRLLVLVFYAAGAFEFFSMRSSISREEALRSAVVFTALPCSYWLHGLSGLAFVGPTLAMLFLAKEIIRTEREEHLGFPLDALAHLSLAFLYIGLFGTVLFVVAGAYPRAVLIWFVLVVIAADTGAFFGGRAIGGKKLAPRISPKKTISGAITGVFCAVVVSILVRHGVGLSPHLDASSIGFGISSGILISILSIFGDLVESLMKRVYEVKDSGTILPGHGGVLDRIDGFLFAAPALFIFGGVS